MVLDFLLSFSPLNLFHLFEEKPDQIVEQYGFLSKEAIEILEYWKNNEGYWNGIKLVKQVKKKALLIAKALYPGYSLLFLFNNATSHLVYSTNTLWVKNMSKRSRDKQVFLRDSLYYQDGLQVTQKMYTESTDGICCQKSIKRVLEERNFWLTKRLKLIYLSPKCLDYQSVVKYKLYVKET